MRRRCSSAPKPAAATSCRITCSACWSISCVFRNAEGLRVHSFVDREPDGAQRGGARDPGLLRHGREARAAARELERRRLRPAGAALPRPAARRRGQQVLGPRRGRPRVQVEQLHRPLPHAPSRPDGPAGDVPAARQRAARRAWRELCGLPGKLGMDGSAVYAAYLDRPARGHPPLLRDRRDEHLPAVLPLPEDARRLHRGRVRARDGLRARSAGGDRRAALGRIPARPGRKAVDDRADATNG